VVSPWLDIVVRSGVILLLACTAILRFRISPEVNSMVENFIVKIKVKK